jgi:ABC-type glycerol-3-phosphate transport system permease component
LNSTIVSVAATSTNVVFCSAAAYGFAKFDFPARQAIFVAVMATLMLPFQVVMIPLYLEVRALGWLGTYQGLVAPGAISAFGIFLMRQYMYAIPNELIDAARIDGASEIRIFVRVILPLCRAPLAALAVLTFLDNWNALLWPLVSTTQVDMRTVALGLTEFQTNHGTLYGPMMAVSTLASIPVVGLVLLTQRQFVKAVMMSGLKG